MRRGHLINKLLKAIFLGHDGDQVLMIIIGHAVNNTVMISLLLAQHPHPFIPRGITFNFLHRKVTSMEKITKQEIRPLGRSGC
jgi:hypothetical protein